MAEQANPSTPATPYNMDAVGWTRWFTALGIPACLATEYGHTMEHEGLVYILRKKIHYVTPL